MKIFENIVQYYRFLKELGAKVLVQKGAAR